IAVRVRMAVDRDRDRARVIEVAGGSSAATVTNHSRIASAASSSCPRLALLGPLDGHASRGARTALQCAAHGERSAGLRTGKGVSGFVHFHQPPQAVHAGPALFAGFVGCIDYGGAVLKRELFAYSPSVRPSGLSS